MAWREISVEDQRKAFIDACIEGRLTMAELCRMYEISPKNGYKWLNRFKAEGIDGLKDRSRAPHNQALKIDQQLTQNILAVRFRFPTWGPKKILAYLRELHPDIIWPSTSTIGNLLDKNGLTIQRKLRRRVPARTTPLSHCQLPNDIWCADFKGWFLTGDENKCEPFTLTDGATRFLFRCINLDKNDTDHVWGVLDAVFREYGLPLFLRHDNGPPFGSCGAGRLTALSVRLIKAGVTPEWIDPGKPQQNGRHERMHQTLKNETAKPSEFTLKEQELKFKEFLYYYNFVRPHEAIAQKTPGSIYFSSPRNWNGKLKSPEYSTDLEVRKVRSGGQISWRLENIFIGYALAGESVGLKEVSDDIFEVSYGPIILGIIDQNKTFISPVEKRKRSGYSNQSGVG